MRWKSMGTVMAMVVAATALALAAPAGAAKGDPQWLPWQGEVEATFAPGGICASGLLRIDIVGTGVGSHLGRFTAEAHQCIDPLTGVGEPGSVVWTAANGDELWATYVEVPGGLAAHFYGGTGRFAHVVVPDPALLHTTVVFTGPGTGTLYGWFDTVIAYDASDRSD